MRRGSVSGGQIAAVKLTHVWVEAFIAYGDYRGAGAGQEGKQWVPIDPAIPGVGKYSAAAPALDALAAMQTTAAELTESYLAAGPELMPLQHYRAQIEQWLS